jgi:hypothetical protein
MLLSSLEHWTSARVNTPHPTPHNSYFIPHTSHLLRTTYQLNNYQTTNYLTLPIRTSFPLTPPPSSPIWPLPVTLLIVPQTDQKHAKFPMQTRIYPVPPPPLVFHKIFFVPASGRLFTLPSLALLRIFLGLCQIDHTPVSCLYLWNLKH